MSTLTIKLLIPDLLKPLELWQKDFAFSPQSPVFSLFLKDIRQRCHRIQGYERNLFYYHGLNVQGELPAATLLYYLDHQKWPDSTPLCAELMHLEGGIDELILQPREQLDLTAEEQTILVTELARYFQEDGWLLENGAQGRAYLFPSAQVLPQTTPPSEVIGKNILDYLPRTDHSKSYLHWHRILTEIQMLLHNSSINLSREANNRAMINTLWLWGGGELIKGEGAYHEGVFPSLTGVLGGNALSQALAHYQHRSWQAMPKGQALSDWLAQTQGYYLVILDDLLLATQYDELSRWQYTWQQMQNDYFAPLYEAWQKNKLELQISFGSGREIIPQKTGWRFWRDKKRDLLDLLL